MELEGGIGWMEGSTLVICATSLTPHEVRAAVARGLGIGEESVRIETPRMGGSFGKYLIPGLEVHLALLVHKTGRPVRLFLERDEILVRRPKRHPFWGRYRLGVQRDGTFLALDADVIAEAGAYVSLTPAVAAVFADEANGAYEIPHLQVRARGVLTNNPPAAPMRGFGSQQINFGIESIVEKAARTLGLDPAAIRRKNFLRTRTDSRGRERPYTHDSLSQTVDVVAEALGARPDSPAGWLSGRGVASIRAKYGYPYGTTDRFVARVSVQYDGRYLDCDWQIKKSQAYYDRVIRVVRGLASELNATYMDNPSYRWNFHKAITVHPLGGCPMGLSEDEGVVNAYGEVFGYPGLYIADGSVMPGPVGPNLALTIAALADYFAEHIVAPARH